MVATSSASRSGWQSGSTCTAVPIFMVLVRAAIAAARISGEASTERSGLKCSSASHIASSPQPLRRVDLREGVGEGLGVARARQTLKLVEHAEFHDASSWRSA